MELTYHWYQVIPFVEKLGLWKLGLRQNGHWVSKRERFTTKGRQTVEGGAELYSHRLIVGDQEP